LNEAGSRISTAEQERHRAFTELAESNGLTGDVSFYDVVSHVPQEDRQYLVDLFRELKIAVMRVQGLNSGIESFVQARSSSLNDLLEVFGPSHRGKVYGRDGAQTHKGRAALVVDTAR
jgi:flagellar biosynthesis/type III secretory pathway chaperone